MATVVWWRRNRALDVVNEDQIPLQPDPLCSSARKWLIWIQAWSVTAEVQALPAPPARPRTRGWLEPSRSPCPTLIGSFFAISVPRTTWRRQKPNSMILVQHGEISLPPVSSLPEECRCGSAEHRPEPHFCQGKGKLSQVMAGGPH